MRYLGARVAWMEKVVWGAILGIVALFGKEAIFVYLDHRRDRRRKDQDEES